MSRVNLSRGRSAEEQASVGAAAEEQEPEDEMRHLNEMVAGGYYSNKDVRRPEAVQVPRSAHARRPHPREAAGRQSLARSDERDREETVRLADPSARLRLHAAHDRVLHEDRIPRLSRRSRRRRRKRHRTGTRR